MKRCGNHHQMTSHLHLTANNTLVAGSLSWVKTTLPNLAGSPLCYIWSKFIKVVRSYEADKSNTSNDPCDLDRCPFDPKMACMGCICATYEANSLKRHEATDGGTEWTRHTLRPWPLILWPGNGNNSKGKYLSASESKFFTCFISLTFILNLSSKFHRINYRSNCCGHLYGTLVSKSWLSHWFCDIDMNNPLLGR